jgi:hypothetical protein
MHDPAGLSEFCSARRQRFSDVTGRLSLLLGIDLGEPVRISETANGWPHYESADLQIDNNVNAGRASRYSQRPDWGRYSCKKRQQREDFEALHFPDTGVDVGRGTFAFDLEDFALRSRLKVVGSAWIRSSNKETYFSREERLLASRSGTFLIARSR